MKTNGIVLVRIGDQACQSYCFDEGLTLETSSSYTTNGNNKNIQATNLKTIKRVLMRRLLEEKGGVMGERLIQTLLDGIRGSLYA